MSPVELIGFVISIIALIFLFFRGRAIERYRQEHPEAFGNDSLSDEDPLKELLKSIDEDEDEDEESEVPIVVPKITKPKPIAAKINPYRNEPLSSIEGRHLITNIEKRKLKSEVEMRHLKSDLDDRRLATRLSNENLFRMEMADRKVGEPRISKTIERLPHLRDMVIYQAILGKPKGLE